MSLGLKTIHSAFLIFLVRMAQRSVGIVSMLVLSRVLSPEDFGIVAIASVTVFFFDVITESGTQQYIIQKTQLSRNDVDTAWTLNLILKSAVFCLFFITSPMVADFLDRPELGSVFKGIAFLLPIGALASPGLMILAREQNYVATFKMLIYEKFVSAGCTIILAVVLKNYWAMVLGILISYLYRTIGSYVVSPYKVQFDLQKINEQWHFSKWILGKGVIGYSKSEVDTVLVSKIFTLTELGGFNLMKNISSIPARELVRPLSEPLLAAFSQSKTDTRRVSGQVQKSICFMLLICMPIVGFLLHYHGLVVRVLFDERWWIYSPVLGILSVLIINFAVVTVLSGLLISLEKVKTMFYFDVTSFILLIALLTLYSFRSINDLAIARVTLSVVTMVILLIYSFRLVECQLFPVSLVAIISVLSSELAVFCTNFLNLPNLINHYFALLLTGATYLSIYCLVTLTLGFWLRGYKQIRPLVEFIVDMIKQLKAKL